MYKRLVVLGLFIAFVGSIHSCKKDPPLPTDKIPTDNNPDPINPGDPTPYTFDFGKYNNEFPPFFIPSDNPMTVEGVELGRHLFYEKMLSKDNSISCGSCHRQDSSFSDGNKQFTVGVAHVIGFRHSMTLFDLLWMEDGFFWDGTERTFEEPVIFPIYR